MTDQQLKYLQLQESRRHNLATEEEDHRANLVKEDLATASNVRQAYLDMENLERLESENAFLGMTKSADWFARTIGGLVSLASLFK